jgi:hypothetical protein
MAKSPKFKVSPEYAIKRLISVDMKLASMTGVANAFNVTGVLLKWLEYKFFAIRLGSIMRHLSLGQAEDTGEHTP